MKNKLTAAFFIIIMQFMTGCVSTINDAIDSLPSIGDLTDPGEIVDSMPASVNGSYTWKDITRADFDAYWNQYTPNRQPPSRTLSLYEKRKDKPIRLYKNCEIKKEGNGWSVEYKPNICMGLNGPHADFEYERGAYKIAEGHPEMLRYLDSSGRMEIYKEGWIQEYTLGSGAFNSFYDIYVYNIQGK